MNTNRKTAITVGALFLIAMVTSLLGGALVESILNTPDYLANISANKIQLVFGVILELTNAVAVVGIAVMMFPIFRKHHEALALAYVVIRTVEAIMQIAGDVIPLSLLTLSQEYTFTGLLDSSISQAYGALFIAARAHLVGTLLGIFFSLGALIFYYLLYQSRLLPRWISVWGFIGAVLIMTWNLIGIFGLDFSAGMILALPMILNEIFLGIWLIAKGFNDSAIASGSVKTEMNYASMKTFR